MVATVTTTTATDAVGVVDLIGTDVDADLGMAMNTTDMSIVVTVVVTGIDIN